LRHGSALNLRRGLTALAAILTLPACSLFDNTDPREGKEATEICLQRVIITLSDEAAAQIETADQTLVPTYTYDITKLGLEALQTLSVPGTDETAGARLIASTNEMSTAVAQFKADPVDEKGAFFMATDPALYRVRGAAMAADQVIAAGCERQLADMRLIDVSVALPVAVAAPESELSTEGRAQ